MSAIVFILQILACVASVGAIDADVIASQNCRPFKEIYGMYACCLYANVYVKLNIPLFIIDPRLINYGRGATSNDKAEIIPIEPENVNTCEGMLPLSFPLTPPPTTHHADIRFWKGLVSVLVRRIIHC